MILKGIPEHCEIEIENDWGINVLDELSEYKKMVKADGEKLKSNKEQIEYLTDQWNKTRSGREWAEQQLKIMSEDCSMLRIQNNKLHQEVISLKAELYDYMKLTNSNS